MRAPLLAFLAFSLALPTAAADGLISIQGEQASWEATHSAGNLVALRSLAGATRPAPSILLEARSVDAEWVESEAYLFEPGSATFLAAFPSTRPEALTNVQLASTEAREGWLVYAFADESARISWRCGGTARAPGEAEITALNQVDGQRPAWTASTTETLLVESCDSKVVIEGDLRLVFWQIDATLQASGESRTVETGRFATEPDAQPALYRARQAFLTVHNGHLEVNGAVEIYLATLDLANAGRIEIAQARGLADGQALEGETVRLEGDMTATLSRDGAGVQVAATGARSADVDGQPLSLGAVPADRPSSLGLIGAGFLVALIVVALALPQVRGYAHYRRAQFYTEKGGEERLRRALDDHRAVERLLHGRRFGRILIHNANEASKTALALHDPMETLAWLELALTHEFAQASQKRL